MPVTRHHAPWRVLTALVTTLAFALMLVVAASHQISAEPPPLSVAPVLVLLPYRVLVAAYRACLYRMPQLLPPCCGPPASM